MALLRRLTPGVLRASYGGQARLCSGSRSAAAVGAARWASYTPAGVDSMLSMTVPEPGRDAAMVATTGPLPRPKSNEVLIRVVAAGVNRPDLMQRWGQYPAPKGASPVPGLEVAGEVVWVGEDVAPGTRRRPRLEVGDAVCALANGGGYAEYCAVNAQHVLPIPRGLSYREAACLPETTLTVWHNAFQPGTLRAGKAMLVHGGSSGIGTTAIQLAKVFGIDVYATAGTDVKCQYCAGLGATPFNYNDDDWEAALRDVGGVDMVLDMVGGKYFNSNLSVLRDQGRLVIIGFLGGPVVAKASLLRILLKRLTVTGSTLRSQTDAEKAAIVEDVRSNAWELASTALRPVLHSRFPLTEVDAAHKRMAASVHVGKIVLDVVESEAGAVPCP